MMACDCVNDFPAKTRDLVASRKPEATNVRASLDNIGYNVRTGEQRPHLTMKITYEVPKAKGGGTRVVKETMLAVASFCPFCGGAYDSPDST